MKAFEIITDIFEVNELKAYATSAMREAENAEQIVTDIKSATGINLDIISGAEEANVILGTFMLLDFDKGRPFVVIDVGGGSTEINIFKKGEQVGSKSFKVGTLRMLRDKINPEVWGEITAWISDYLLPFEEYLIFGTGGNINKAHKLLAHGPNDAASIEELIGLKNELDSLDLSERMKKFQLRPDRADVIVPALDIYTNILANFKSKLIHVPKVGLSDGMVYQMYLQENDK
jgi:exopolyphosphatase/guanosine-5'-triphosphate,3'-diphosphate pyrophosphatase